MKKVRMFLAVFIFLLGICYTSAAENDNGEVNSVLAMVNGQAVTLMDVLPLTRAKEMQARSVYSGDRLLQEIRDYRRKAVDDLIDNILVRDEFTKHQFQLSNQDVEREIDQFALRMDCHSRSELLKCLRRDGTDIEEIRLEIRKNLMVQLMLFRQIKIADPLSPRELYEYFKNNESSFASPAKVALSMLKLDTSTPDMDAVSAGISKEVKENPDNFSALIKKYNPSFGDGNIGEIECKLLRPEFAAAFDSFVPGKIAGPIKVYDGVVWLKVISYTPEKKVEFRDVEDKIKFELERRSRESVVKRYAEKLRSKAMIEYFF